MNQIVEIELTKGVKALIDSDDFAEVSKHRWYAQVSGKSVYAARSLSSGGKRIIYLHKFLNPTWEIVDHINGLGVDCRRANMREATKRQNQQNQGPKGGSSRFKGVYFSASSGKWYAQCRRKHLGCFHDEVDAAKAYDERAVELYGEFAWVNFPAEE